jgi:hyperosmotically inducible periplasmic protein
MQKRLVGLGLCAAMSLLGATAVMAETSDSWITTKAKITLLTTDGVSGSKVNVDTVDGKVTLHGKVPTEAEKAKAETAVRTLDGVKEVKNLLQVVPEERKEAVNATDDSIKKGVEGVLDADKGLKDVNVSSVNQGVVLLSGKTATLQDTLRAIEKAGAVPGVRRVSSEIEAPEK